MSGDNAHLPRMARGLCWGRQRTHSHCPHTRRPGEQSQTVDETSSVLGMNLTFLPEEEDGSKADLIRAGETELQLCFTELSAAKPHLFPQAFPIAPEKSTGLGTSCPPHGTMALVHWILGKNSSSEVGEALCSF